jgi:hypothetical protein
MKLIGARSRTSSELLPTLPAAPVLVRSSGGHFMDKPDNVISLSIWPRCEAWNSNWVMKSIHCAFAPTSTSTDWLAERKPQARVADAPGAPLVETAAGGEGSGWGTAISVVSQTRAVLRLNWDRGLMLTGRL